MTTAIRQRNNQIIRYFNVKFIVVTVARTHKYFLLARTMFYQLGHRGNLNKWQINSEGTSRAKAVEILLTMTCKNLQ